MPDVVIGVIFFAAFIVMAYAGGRALESFNRGRHTRALAALAPLIGGEVDGDGSAAWMTGIYGGRRVRARMMPGRDVSASSEYSIKINSWEVVVLELPGAERWEIAYTGLLRKSWNIRTKDEALKERLSHAGLADELQRMGNAPSAWYEPGERALWYLEDVRPRWLPAEERFRAQLELVVRMAGLNERVNGE